MYAPPPAILAPIIECSLPSHSWMANQLSVVACLTKPITAQELRREVENLTNVQRILIVDDDQVLPSSLHASWRQVEQPMSCSEPTAAQPGCKPCAIKRLI